MTLSGLIKDVVCLQNQVCHFSPIIHLKPKNTRFLLAWKVHFKAQLYFPSLFVSVYNTHSCILSTNIKAQAIDEPLIFLSQKGFLLIFSLFFTGTCGIFFASFDEIVFFYCETSSVEALGFRFLRGWRFHFYWPNMIRSTKKKSNPIFRGWIVINKFFWWYKRVDG